MREPPGDGKVLVLCDFDGTISRTDVGNRLFNRFTGRGWQEIDEAYCRGEIGSREAYTRVAAILEGDRERMLAFVLREAELDGHFPAFRRFCRETGLDLIIVSDGLDFYINAVLRKHGLEDIPIHANRTLFRAGKPPSIEFPWASEDCGRCGTCKRGILRSRRGRYDVIVYVGNGHSDVCPSAEADLVFAKGVLLQICQERHRSCVPFENFSDVLDFLNSNPSRSSGAGHECLRGACASDRIEENSTGR
ncbi:MAG: MtnX-like HAD-IB family phosphatase [Syntrophaceae bacterium]|nr:MtnX-like HAD-IB family phosphatase [Syntrophaceae bacterium]